MDNVGAEKLRSTKDLDIVLVLKPRDEFIVALKSYLNSGRYEIQKGENNQAHFYRFQKPSSGEYPVMIEFFMPFEEGLSLFEGQHIIPVTGKSSAGSLSAILLDKEYYSLIERNAVLLDGVNILNELALIPFKAKAYLEIKERKEDSKGWKKHRADIINLAVNLLTEETSEKLSGKVRDNFVEFLNQLKVELDDEIVKGACNQKIEPEIVISLLEKTFL